MNKLPISVCIISGAEEKRITRCLKSVAGWTAEIIIVLNTEVTDGTEAVAQSFGAKIYRHAWQGFREQKNLALRYASCEWILSVDADEEVSAGLKEAIEIFLRSPEKYAGARFPRKVWFLGRWIRHGDWYPDRVLRLFRRGQGEWKGSMEHCAVETAGSVKTISGDLLHYTNPDINSYINKINYYADLHLQRQLEEKTSWSAVSAVTRPIWRFVRAYFFRLGFLDGFPGFFIAATTAYSTLVRHSRLYEHSRRSISSCEPPTSP